MASPYTPVSSLEAKTLAYLLFGYQATLGYAVAVTELRNKGRLFVNQSDRCRPCGQGIAMLREFCLKL